MDVAPVAPEHRLRIAVLADFEGPHARAWVRWAVARGHDVHAISYYAPGDAIEGATMHALKRSEVRGQRSGRTSRRAAASRVPRGLLRLAHAMRYRRAGLARIVREIAPDVLHAHFLVEHGFYGAVASGFRPYVVTAWGSDVLVEPRRDPVSRLIAKWTLTRADAVTSNNAYMAERVIALGGERARVHEVVLGAERYDLERHDASVNVRVPDASRVPVVISTRAHEPLYNIGDLIDASALLAKRGVSHRLVIAHEGSQTAALRGRVEASGAPAEFVGRLDRAAFRDALAGAEVFVSVPSSDGTSVALLQAMAAGCYPIVSDLPTQHEWVAEPCGIRVPVHDVAALAAAVQRALGDAELRRRAAASNRALVEERGLNETQMLRLEAIYLRLAKRLA